MQWLQDGDRNTKFFYVQVNGRRKRMQIKRIQDHNGNWLEDIGSISDKAVRFFNDQFKEDRVPTDFRVLEHIPSLLEDG